MSWLCGGCGVSNENTIEAGRRALAHHQWDRGRKLMDTAWRKDPDAHRTIIDLCEQAVDRATLKYQALGEGPAPITLDAVPDVEPDPEALENLQKEQTLRRKEHDGKKKASLARLHQWHRLAKRYNKRLMSGLQDPVALGHVYTHVGLHHKALSATSPKGYDHKHNQRAFDYFSQAIASFDEAHLPQPQPVAGRMDVVADRLVHTTEHWYKMHQKKQMRDATGLLMDDFVRLINMPTSYEERVQNLESLALLMERDLPPESHDFMLHEVMGPLSRWLCDPSEHAASLRMPVLAVFEQIIRHQEWAKHEAGDALYRFVSNESLDLTLEHMQVLYPCYRGLIEGKSKNLGRYDILPALDVMRRRLRTNDKALVQVQVLLDDIVRFGSSHSREDALHMVLTIGTESPADNVQYSALVILDHLAGFAQRESVNARAIQQMATLISTMKNPQLREYGIVRLAYHSAHPGRLEAADYALYNTLGLTRVDVELLHQRSKEIYDNISAIEASTGTPTVAL